MFYLLHSCITFTFPKLVIFIFIYSNCLSYLILAIISSNNPIIYLLANEKLRGDIFVKWKSNINIVLICENQKFVLSEKCPPEPPANASRTVRERYDNWIHSNNKGRCDMLAIKNDVLRRSMRTWGLHMRYGNLSKPCLGDNLTSFVMKLLIAT